MFKIFREKERTKLCMEQLAILNKHIDVAIDEFTSNKVSNDDTIITILSISSSIRLVRESHFSIQTETEISEIIKRMTSFSMEVSKKTNNNRDKILSILKSIDIFECESTDIQSVLKQLSNELRETHKPRKSSSNVFNDLTDLQINAFDICLTAVNDMNEHEATRNLIEFIDNNGSKEVLNVNERIAIRTMIDNIRYIID